MTNAGIQILYYTVTKWDQLKQFLEYQEDTFVSYGRKVTLKRTEIFTELYVM